MPIEGLWKMNLLVAGPNRIIPAQTSEYLETSYLLWQTHRAPLRKLLPACLETEQRPNACLFRLYVTIAHHELGTSDANAEGWVCSTATHYHVEMALKRSGLIRSGRSK